MMIRQFGVFKGRKKLALFGVIFVLCLGGAMAVQLVRNHASGKPANTAKGMQTSVDVLTVSRSNLMKRISLVGQTVPKAQVDIAAKYQGRVTAVNAELGQAVAEGQVLVVQDTGDAELSIMQNQANYRQAAADAVSNEVSYRANFEKYKADYERSRSSYQRYQTLYEAGAISLDQLDTSRQQMVDAKAALDTLANQISAGPVPASVEAAQAAAAKAQHSVAAAEKQRDDLVLRAPRSGIIGARQVEVGAFVQAGQKLLTLVDNSGLYVDCQVSEQDLGLLAVGMDVGVQIESLGKTYAGKVIYISPANDSQSLSFTLRIALTNPDPAVKSGMFARTVVQSVLQADTLVVPKEAVQEKNGKYSVFALTDKGTVEERPVTVGLKGDLTVQIVSGLQEGDRIAVSNLSRLRSGLAIVANPVTLDNWGEGK